jgi:hypothetical protein
MDYNVLVNKINEDNLIDTPSEQILAGLKANTIKLVSPSPVMIKYRTIANKYGIEFAEKIITALSSVSSGTGSLNTAISHLLPTMLNDGPDSGIDITSPTTRELIDNFTNGDNGFPVIFEEDDADNLKNMGCIYRNWAGQNGWGGISVGNIEWAKKMINEGVGS